MRIRRTIATIITILLTLTTVWSDCAYVHAATEDNPEAVETVSEEESISSEAEASESVEEETTAEESQPVESVSDEDTDVSISDEDELPKAEDENGELIEVTYDANGGVFENGESLKVVIETKNDALQNVPADPIFSDGSMEFKGWYLDKDCFQEVDMLLFASEEDVTLYAGWNTAVSEVAEEEIELNEAGDIASGEDWRITSEGEFIADGSGDLYRYMTLWDKPDWEEYKDKIKKATIKQKGMNSLGRFFDGCTNLVSADFSEASFSNSVNMEYMFRNCTSLKYIAFPDTSFRIINMRGTFAYCESLESVNVGKFNTADNWTMESTFDNCKSLKTLDVSNWNTSNVNSMAYMFRHCDVIDGLDVSKWDTSEVTDMKYLFAWCYKVRDLDVSKWNTSKVIFMTETFQNCESLTELDVSKWNTSKVIDMAALFNYCILLKEIDVSKWDTSSVCYMPWMFSVCPSLETINISGFDTSNVSHMWYMFYGCESLNELDVSNFDTSNVEYTRHMFENCTGLKELNLSSFRLPKVTDTSDMLKGCTNLKTVVSPTDSARTITLPGNGWKRTDTWASVDEIPKNLTDSVTFYKGNVEISLDNTSYELKKNDAVDVVVTTTPSGIDISGATWTTSDAEIATVTKKTTGATITAGGKEGTATITVKVGASSATITVTVRVPIKLDKNVIFLTAKDGAKSEFSASVVDKYKETAQIKIIDSEGNSVTNIIDVQKSVETAGLYVVSVKNGLDISEAQTVYARLYVTDGGEEIYDECKVTISPVPTALAPIASVGTAGGTKEVSKGTFVSLSSATFGADIYYTTDGSTDPAIDVEGKPAEGVSEYCDRIQITEPMTIKAIAYKAGYKVSDVQTYAFTIDESSDDSWGDVTAPFVKYQYANKSSSIPQGIWYVINGVVYKNAGTSDFALEYTGDKVTFNGKIEVYCGNRQLCENRDYTVSYSNNTAAILENDSEVAAGITAVKTANPRAKIPTVTIKGKGNYKDKSVFEFGIYKADIDAATYLNGDTTYVVAGPKVKLNSVKPAIVLNGKTLKLNKDYEYTYFDATDSPIADPAKEIVSAAGKTYTIQAKAKDGSNLIGIKSAKVTVTSVTAKADIPVAPVKTKMSKVKIAGLSTTVEYTGEQIELQDLFKADKTTKDPNGDKNEADAWNQVTLYNVDAKTKAKTVLKQYVPGLGTATEFATGVPEDAGYVVDMDNTGVTGKFTLTFTGMNAYEGSVKKTITVKAYNVKKDARGALIIDDIPAVDYVKTGAKPSVTVKYVTEWADESKTTPSEFIVLEEGIDYTLTYKNNVKPALSTAGKKAPIVTIKGKGNYTGANATKTFTINKANVKDNVELTVADVIYNSKGKAGYFMVTPKIKDSGKAVTAGKNKDIEAIGKTAYKYYYAEDTELADEAKTPRYAGTEVLKADKAAPGTRIKVTATVVVKSDNSPYNKTGGEGVTIEGYYNIIYPDKDISKMNASIVKGTVFSFHNGDEVIPIKETQIEVKPKGKNTIALIPSEYEIVSVVNNRFLGKATVTIRGRNGYGGTKIFTFKISARSLS